MDGLRRWRVVVVSRSSSCPGSHFWCRNSRLDSFLIVFVKLFPLTEDEARISPSLREELEYEVKISVSEIKIRLNYLPDGGAKDHVKLLIAGCWLWMKRFWWILNKSHTYKWILRMTVMSWRFKLKFKFYYMEIKLITIVMMLMKLKRRWRWHK